MCLSYVWFRKLLLWKDEVDEGAVDGIAAAKEKTTSSNSSSSAQQSSPAKRGLVPGSVKWQALKTGMHLLLTVFDRL